MSTSVFIDGIVRRIGDGEIVPYLGPGLLALCADPRVPATSAVLAQSLTAKVSVPYKIRNRLTQAAQFIENFKHRKSVVGLMNDAFAATPAPSPLHLALAASGAGLYVDSWYDDTFAAALAHVRGAAGWAQVQGLSQAEHMGRWFGAYDAHGGPLADVPDAGTLLYKPIGSHGPAANYLVSDSDFVEVLTEIDIQTPIPPAVQAWRSGRSFLFIGCRFDDQLTRAFARQIMKRSSDTHWAVLPDEPTRMEARFLDEQRITRIAMPLTAFADAMVSALQPALAA